MDFEIPIVIADTLGPIVLNSVWIERALLLSTAAGWSQTEADWAVFFAHGTVLGFTKGDRLVATAAALPYGNEFGWISMVLVTPEYRRQGLAYRLVAACTSILRDASRAALLDAAPAALGIYTDLGFVPLCGMERWEGLGGGEASVAASTDAALYAIDQLAFGADRRFLLEDFLSRPGSMIFESPYGYAILRQGLAASHIGPVVASLEEAPALIDRAIRAASGSVLVDVLDSGNGITPTLVAHGFRKSRSFTRMGLGITALPGDRTRLLAAAGPEFG